MIKSTRKLLLAFFAALLIISPVISLLPSSSTSAEIKGYGTMSADQQIASYIFYNALKTCISGDFVNKKVDDLSSIDKMFAGQQHEISVGLLAENVASKFTSVTIGDGVMRCESVAKAAFGMWGMTGEDAASLFETFGYTKTDSYRCIGIDPRDDDELKPIHEDEATTIPFALSKYTLGTGAYVDLDGDNQITTLGEYSSLCRTKVLSTGWYVYTDENDNEKTYEPILEADKAYVASSDLITKFIEYVKSKIFGITSYQGSEHGGNVSLTEPSLNDAQKYYYYKYYFVNEDICNAKTYGLTSSLETSRTVSEVANIRGGKINGQTYPYIEVPMIDNANGTLNTYSFIMESEQAYANESLPIVIDSKTSTTCSDVVAQLTNLSKNVSNEIINYGSNGVVYGKIVSDSLGLTAVGGQTENSDSNSDGGEATCGSSVTGVGWIVCPVVDALVALNDGAWKMVESMLVVNPLTQTGNKSYIYQGWEIIRNIANIAFVIIFLIVIFSQVTGFGINNYGIKKLLPKIIVGAILVNLSFFIMQIAVDLSNIVGKSLYNLILGAVPSIEIELNFQAVVNSILKASALNAATLGAAAGSIALITTVGGPGTAFLLLLPGLAMAFLALFAALLTLLFRQAAIPILAMLAPLAFVAYLLPNTENWFKKWKKILIDALMLYPFAAVIFSGAKFVATVIIGDGSNWLSMMMGTIILVLPLGSLPFLASKGGALTDAVLKGANNMFGKLKSPISNFSKERAGYTKARFDNQAMNGKNGLFYGTRRMYMQNKLRQKTAMQNFERQTGKANSEYVISELEKGPGSKSKLYKQMAMKGQPNNAIYNSAAAKYNASIISNAISEREAMNQKEIGSIVSEFNNKNAGFDEIKVEMLKAIKSGDMNRTRAMQNLLLNKGGAGKTALEDTYDSIYKGTKLSYIDKNGTTVDETLNSTYLTNGNQETIRLNQVLRSDLNAANVKSSNIILHKFASQKSYNTDIDAITNDVSTYAGLTPLELVGQSAKNFGRAIRAGVIDNATANLIATSPETMSKLDDDKWRSLYIKFGITKEPNKGHK